ncbi:MAG: Crp/Fnr family transcriptional regulator [Nitrospirae bacterium]|nr:Crp/Fnr family transcriptional regulator [Nitrospirota bacterium]
MKTIPLFTHLSPEELLDLEKFIIRKHVLKNEIILLEEDTLNYMYFIYSGKVKAVQISDNGREHILAIHKSGESFGELSLLDGKTSPATVIAVEDTHIGLISKKDFEQYFLGNNKVFREMALMLCRELREAWLRLKILRFADAEHKVRALLKLISEQNGVKDTRGTIITLKLTHEDIANYASVSRETVTRVFGRLLKEGEIEILERKYILLKPLFFKKTLLV